tara:strand:- start:220 stop:1008 length:789 start_codon:yes stop_codon:yes gene_type:complete
MERKPGFPGVVLALETATRPGSVAVLQHGKVVASKSGTTDRTRGERLPSDIIDVLGTLDLTVDDVERYAVAVGPGSFTGLRVGISTIQGLSLVKSVPIVGVSTLAALVDGARDSILVGAWLDGQRNQVFSAGYLRRLEEVSCSPPTSASIGGVPTIITVPEGFLEIEPHSVGTPQEVSICWQERLGEKPLTLVGDGAHRYESEAKDLLGSTVRILPIQVNLAENVGRLALTASDRQLLGPHALRPLYIRRPDVELARNRSRG